MEENINYYISAVLFLLFLSALFSCFETAIVATSRAKIHRLRAEGNRRAKILEGLLKNREKVVSTMLLGNNAINILASAITTTVFLEIFGDKGLFYATILMTVTVLIFSEILPKSYAIKHPDSISLFFAPLISFLVTIFFPLTNSAQKIVDFVISLFSKKPSKKHSISELEEIRDTVNLKHIEGSIYKYDKDMIDGVLDLSDTEISEIMVHRKEIESINIELPVKEIIHQALNMNYTRIPLWQNNKENIVAILNVRKLLKALYFCKSEKELEKFDLKSITTEAWFVPNTNSLRTQLFIFRKKKKRFALVIDEYGSLQGLVTLEDILEEIVGEIKEQEDSLEVNIVKIKSGACKIAGKVLIRDINKKLDWNLPEDVDAYNLAGFIISSLGRIPDEKEIFSIGEYNFEILRKKANDLIWVKIKKILNS
jgi:Mg2+/Co2+ transporter CorB